MAARYAIYFSPPQGSPLWELGAGWLGRAPEEEASRRQPPVAGLAPERLATVTASPRLYGFHATIKAPFHLAAGLGEADLAAALEALCTDLEAFPLPPLRLADLDGFLALVPSAPSRELACLERAVVMRLDAARATLSEEDRARRHSHHLTARQSRYLERWGYPYVLDEFRFHMTLTERLTDAAERRILWRSLAGLAAPFVGSPLTIDALSLFVQSAPGAPFVVRARVPLGISVPLRAGEQKSSISTPAQRPLRGRRQPRR